jgi:hypothetical protein
MTQLVATPVRASMFSQMHLKSSAVQLVSLARASSMQGRAQAGMSERDWAETAAARARAAKEYLILAVCGG